MWCVLTWARWTTRTSVSSVHRGVHHQWMMREDREMRSRSVKTYFETRSWAWRVAGTWKLEYSAAPDYLGQLVVIMHIPSFTSLSCSSSSGFKRFNECSLASERLPRNTESYIYRIFKPDSSTCLLNNMNQNLQSYLDAQIRYVPGIKRLTLIDRDGITLYSRIKSVHVQTQKSWCAKI